MNQMPSGQYIRPSLLTRFESKYIPEPNSGCWLWIAYMDRLSQAGQFWYGGRLMQAYRASYLMFKGSIPSGYEIDHLCQKRWCVNPQHLEAVTPQENYRRAAVIRYGDACKRRHEYSISKSPSRKGNRICLECIKASRLRRKGARYGA